MLRILSLYSFIGVCFGLVIQSLSYGWDTIPLVAEARRDFGASKRYARVDPSHFQVKIHDGLLYYEATGKLLDGGSRKFIFVADESGTFYMAHPEEVTHHSDFVHGAPVAAAGEMLISKGKPIFISNKSGHYRPYPKHLNQAVEMLQANHVDISNIQQFRFYHPSGHPRIRGAFHRSGVYPTEPAYDESKGHAYDDLTDHVYVDPMDHAYDDPMDHRSELVPVESPYDSYRHFDACPTVRLDERGGSTEHLPVFRQKEGNCFAVTAAQLIDAYRYSHGDNRYDYRISPLILGIETKASHLNIDTRSLPSVLKTTAIQENLIESGSVLDALELVRQKGACSSQLVRDFLPETGRVQSFYDQLREIKDELRRRTESSSHLNQAFHEIHRLSQELTTCLSNRGIHESLLPAPFHGTSDTLLRILEKSVDARDFAGKLALAIASKCPHSSRIHVDIPQPAHIEFEALGAEERQNQLIHLTDQLFSKSTPPTQPFGVGFCYEILKHPDSLENCSMHAAIVIGQKRSSEGECMLLIQNSAGNNCLKYDPRYSCEEGKIWVPKATLGNVLKEAWYLRTGP